MALQDVDLCLEDGEVVALVGPSGSGKTTLARALRGHLPTAGSLTLRGRVGYVPQDPRDALDPRVSLRQHLADIGAPVEATLADVSLPPELADRVPYTLSGGQAQRAALALALGQRDLGLLLFDEPTSALDPATASATLLSAIGSARRRGAALVVITHDLAVAAAADRVLYMYAGTIVQICPSSGVRPAHAEAARLWDAWHAPTRPLPAPTPSQGLQVHDLAVAGRLRPTTFHAPVGAFTALTGASGSGKSTALRAIIGLETFTGSVLVEGRPCAPGQVQLVWQDARASLDPRFTVARTFAQIARIHGQPEDTLRRLGEVGLEAALASRAVGTLSGGQAQRVAIARALIPAPPAGTARVLLADEPTSGLDPISARQTLTLLQAVASEGAVVVMASHDELALRYADARCAVG